MSKSRNGPNPALGPRKDWITAATLVFLPLLAVLMLAFGLHQMGTVSGGAVGWAKLTIICIAAFLVSYVINRLALEKGIPLYSKGKRAAAVASVSAMVFVGTSFFTTTAPGYVLPSVMEAELSKYQDAMGEYAIGRIAVADRAKELVPLMHSVAEDLQSQLTAETGTGFGPIATMLQSLFDRANGLSGRMTASLGVRQSVLDRIHALREAMNRTLADEKTDIWIRRTQLRSQHGEMLSLLSELEKAIPVSVVKSYASELGSGILIPNREDASARINRTLSGYSDALAASLAEQRGVEGAPPEFPAKPGTLDTFSYIGVFAPIFLLTFAVDLLFPILLFFLTLWTVSTVSPPPVREKKHRALSDLDVLLAMKAADVQQLSQFPDGTTLGSEDFGRTTKPNPSRPNGHAKQ